MPMLSHIHSINEANIYYADDYNYKPSEREFICLHVLCCRPVSDMQVSKEICK